MRRASLFGAVLITAMASGFHVPAAQAQSGSVKAVFEKYNLLGTFASDCGRPVSKNNIYYVNRLLDTDRVQRDLMEGPAARVWYVILDQARETRPNEIYLSGTRDNGQPTEGIWRIEPNRVKQWDATLNGRKVIAGGKLVSNGTEMPWFNKCGGR